MMIKRRVIILICVLSVFFVYFIFYPPKITPDGPLIEIYHVPPEGPQKPVSVPESAFWLGGPDGGVFVLIFKSQEEKIYSGTIYAETGFILYQGEFIYVGGADFDVSDKSKYSFWDGDSLFMANGDKLIATTYQEAGSKEPGDL